MKNVAWILCLCGLLAFGLAAGALTPKSSNSDNGRVLYKWVDKDGVTHYGDHVPPEYATQEQHVLNSQGYEIRHLDAQKSAEQASAEEQKTLDAQQRQLRDKNLLNTYSSVQEIERLRRSEERRVGKECQ